MDKFVFASDQLPPGLSNERRFKAWLDLYNANVGHTDLSPSAAPFDARTAFARAKDVVLVQASATIAQAQYGGSRAAPGDEERVGLLVNVGPDLIHSFHRGHDQFIPPGGSMLLSRADPGRFLLRADTTAWIIIDMPRTVIVKAATKAEDLVGTPLVAGGEALRMINGYAGLIFREEGFADPQIEAHVSQTILDLVGLAVGAEKDVAELARGRGLRTARLDAILQAIAKGHADPSFSIAVVARGLGLSERYVQDLLQSTGSGFAERVLELRLQNSVNLLARGEATRRKVSDVGLRLRLQRPLLLPPLLPPPLRHDAGGSAGGLTRAERMDTVVFSSDQLPPGLNESQRFKAWCDLYNQFVGRGDLVPSEAPFEAHMAFVGVGDVVLGQVSTTVRHSEHGGPRATAADEGRVGLLINTGAAASQCLQRGHEALVPPGGSVFLSRSDLGRFRFAGATASWLIIDMPRLAIVRTAPQAEDRVGKAFVAGSEALRMISGYAGLLLREEGFVDPRLDAHVSQTILDLVGLAVGAEKDAGELARRRGLRAGRLDAVLQAIARGYADPSFSIAVVARRLGLSERYIQDLLQTTGSGFAERVMELRLQQSVSLLARAEATRRKVSDVAFACGFNDLSYFHRCFRRRFGMTPAGARAG